MTFKNNRAPLLCYFKLCASFRSHWWIQTGVTVRKRLIWVKIDNFFSRVTLKFDGWPSKTTGHLFYSTSSFVYHFVAIAEFKLELQSRNAQSGSNSTLFRAVWPWNLTGDGWGCEVSCGGHHRPRGKTTTGSALDGAVFDIAQILAYLVHNMSRSQLYLGFGHFGWLPSFFGQ